MGGSGRSPKRAVSPTLRDGIIPVECSVHDGGPDFQHQMSAPRRPAHLLLGMHSPMQQPLHRALGDRRRNWFFASAGCGIVDNDIRLSRNICVEVAQKARHLACGGSDWGSVASFDCGGGLAARGIVPTSQAATSNSAAMNSAWALMSLPLMFRTCPFLIIAIAS